MSASDYDLAAAGRAIAEPARAAMLLRMMDGQAHTARDLAVAARLRPSAATAHLRHLVDARLVAVTASGRQKLHTLASPEVATAIEALAAISPLLPVESLRAARTGTQLQVARACYSHLGGALAVAIGDRLAADGTVDPLRRGQAGHVRTLDHPLLSALAISELPAGSGPAVRGCLDWTEGAPPPGRAPRLRDPFGAAGAYAAGVGSMAILRFSDTPGLGVIHLAALSGGVSLEDRDDLARYVRAFAQLRAAALSPAASARLLGDMARD